MSNLIEIHCQTPVEKAIMLAYLKHFHDIYEGYVEVDVVESNGNHLEEEDYRTKVFLNKRR